jgi:hypothetical protein
MMLIGLMFVDDMLEHGFEDFVDNLDISFGLKVVWGGKLLGES